jgi:hypothetical protein
VAAALESENYNIKISVLKKATSFEVAFFNNPLNTVRNKTLLDWSKSNQMIKNIFIYDKSCSYYCDFKK